MNGSNDCDLIASLFPNTVQLSMSQEPGLVEELYKEEQALIEHAIKKRQSDFAAGRLCARMALANLGIEEFPLLMDDKGAPVWPEGVAGSISHTRGCCVVVVTRAHKGESLGLGIEEVNRIKEFVWEYGFGSEEITWLKKQSVDSQKCASVIFAAKEAFYKAQYPLTHSWLGFKDVVITIDKEPMEFTVRLLVDLGKWSKGMLFNGRYGFLGKYVAAGAWIEK